MGFVAVNSKYSWVLDRSVGAVLTSYRNPRFNVSFRLAFQSSCRYHPRNFLFIAGNCWKPVPGLLAPDTNPPAPTRKEANPDPVPAVTFCGSGPSVKEAAKGSVVTK